MDKEAVIRSLNGLMETLRREMGEQSNLIAALRAKCSDYEKSGNLDEEKTVEMVFEKVDRLQAQLNEAEREEAKWTVRDDEMIHSEPRNVTESEMKAVFSRFDEDGDGHLIGNELQHALKSVDRHLTDHDVAHLMQSTNLTMGGEVGFDEFAVICSKIKSRFVEQFEAKLVEAMDAALRKMEMVDGDSGGDSDSDSDGDDDEWTAFCEVEVADLKQELVDQEEEYRESMASWKRKYDDLVESKLQSEQQWNAKHDVVEQLLDELETAKSEAVRLRMERKVLLDSNRELKEEEEVQCQRLLAVTESAQLFEAKLLRQNEEWEAVLRGSAQKLAATEHKMAAILNELEAAESERESLRKQLKAQKRLCGELALRSGDEAATKRELMDRVEHQKALMVRLEAERADLLAAKEADDKRLVMELEQLRSKSMVTKRLNSLRSTMSILRLENASSRSVRTVTATATATATPTPQSVPRDRDRSVRFGGASSFNFGPHRQQRTELGLYSNGNDVDLEHDLWSGQYLESMTMASNHSMPSPHGVILEEEDEDLVPSPGDRELLNAARVTDDDGDDEERENEEEVVERVVVSEAVRSRGAASCSLSAAMGKEEADWDDLTVLGQLISVMDVEREERPHPARNGNGGGGGGDLFGVSSDRELDFFLLTAICCKTNLLEEYPDRLALSEEDALALFAVAQREQVEMRKFALWIELQLRHKHDLPKMGGFKRFCGRFKFGDEAKRRLAALRSVVGHGLGQHGVAELVRKFHKHRGRRCSAKRDDALQRLVERSKERWQQIERRNAECIEALGNELPSAAERRLFGGVFVKMSKFLYYVRVLAATLALFQKDIERMCRNAHFQKVEPTPLLVAKLTVAANDQFQV